MLISPILLVLYIKLHILEVYSNSKIIYIHFSIYLVPTTISISIQDISFPLSTNPYLLIDYNDTNPLATNSVINTTLPYTGSYTYMAPGIYSINLTVYNQVSVETKILNFSINAQFDNYKFSICYLLPTLTDPLNDICNLTLINGKYFIPKQSQLVIYVTWSNPSNKKFKKRI